MKKFTILLSILLLALAVIVYAIPPSPPGAGSVSDTAYNATSWDGVTDVAPSKNAVRDKVEALSLAAGAPTDAHYLTDQAEGGLSAEVVVSANGKSLVTAANYAGMKTLLGLTVGADVQAYNSNLTGINQALDSAANPSFSTINVVGANSLNLGTAGSLVGGIRFKNATSGYVEILPPTGALGTGAITLPASGTLATTSELASYFPLTGGTITGVTIFDPTVTGTLMDFRLATEWTSGTILNAAFGSGTTIGGNVLGVGLDFNTNVSTSAAHNFTGFQIKTPSLTQSSSNTTTFIGYDLPTAGALISQTNPGSTINWKGLNIQMPNITQSDGATNSYGVYINGGTVTSGTQYALFVDSGNVRLDGSLGDTTNRVVKGWFVDAEFTNAPTINGGTFISGIGAAPLASPPFTGSVILPSANADPAATAGSLVHDSVIGAGGLFDGGALRYYNGAAIKQLIDMTAATAEACTNGQVVAYNSTSDLWYCADAGSGTGDLKSDGTVAMSAALVPNAANTVALGSTAAEWADIYFGDGAIIYGQNDQSNTLTSSATGWTANLKISAPTFASYVATGTAPLTVASTTVVANLNASALGGATFAAPGAIGSGTAAAGTFTTVTADSFTANKSSGVAGRTAMYEANSTDIQTAGHRGPASLSYSYEFQLPNTRPVAADTILLHTNVGETGTGADNANPYVQATSYLALGTGISTALAVNVGSAGAPVVNGGALGTPSSGTATNITGLPFTTGVTAFATIDGSGGTGPTAAQMQDPRCRVTNYGQAATDVAVALPVPADNQSCLFVVEATQAGNKWGVQAATNDKITIIAADGTVATGSDNGYARMTAATVYQSFACWSSRTGASSWDWTCKAIAIAGSTFAAN